MLAVSCNEPPHELLLYNLESGRGKELIGHDTQVQAIEFALGGERVVSCASNIVKVLLLQVEAKEITGYCFGTYQQENWLLI